MKNACLSTESSLTLLDMHLIAVDGEPFGGAEGFGSMTLQLMAPASGTPDGVNASVTIWVPSGIVTSNADAKPTVYQAGTVGDPEVTLVSEGNTISGTQTVEVGSSGYEPVHLQIDARCF